VNDAMIGLRTMLSLGAVLALLALFAWALRRGSLKLSRLAPRGTIVVETATSLGERRQLAIVTVEGRRVLIGMTPTTIAFLTELAATPAAAAEGAAR
jgi:flagellar protein FliO/FliZ